MGEQSSSSRKMLHIPLNRVEGDLEIRLEVQDGAVKDAWSAGMLYRGFENLLTGRAPLDSLVITPRICGICSTAHLVASVRALESLAGIIPPVNALRVRQLTLMVEHVQSDMRHHFLHFAPDFVNSIYQDKTFFDEAWKRYRPIHGQLASETIQHTRQILEIIAILGGQWPHSSFMVPGGITQVPKPTDLLHCRYLLNEFRHWYEMRVLGCSLERWQEVKSPDALDHWLEEKDTHRTGEVGFFLECARAAGLDKLGQGPENFIYNSGLGILNDNAELGSQPDGVLLQGKNPWAQPIHTQPFDHTLVTEHVSHAWFVDDEPRHPFDGSTRPEVDEKNSRPYSWAKAPRYAGLPAETGPLATALVNHDQLFLGLIQQAQGSSVLIRQLARLVRPACYLARMDAWLAGLLSNHDPYYLPQPNNESVFREVEGKAVGMVEASRGLLGHWVKVHSGHITSYQIITPTGWNGSPRDDQGQRGPWEQALLNAPVTDTENPIAVGHIVRSFDACLVCTVHTIKR